jgi:hypothetical protein
MVLAADPGQALFRRGALGPTEPAVGETIKAKPPGDGPVPVGPPAAPVIVQPASSGAFEVDLPGDGAGGCPPQRADDLGPGRVECDFVVRA